MWSRNLCGPTPWANRIEVKQFTYCLLSTQAEKAAFFLHCETINLAAYYDPTVCLSSCGSSPDLDCSPYASLWHLCAPCWECYQSWRKASYGCPCTDSATLHVRGSTPATDLSINDSCEAQHWAQESDLGQNSLYHWWHIRPCLHLCYRNNSCLSLGCMRFILNSYLMQCATYITVLVSNALDGK